MTKAEIVEQMQGTHRLLLHGRVNPNQDGDLDAMDELQRQLKQVRAEIDVASESGDLAAERPPHHLGPVEG